MILEIGFGNGEALAAAAAAHPENNYLGIEVHRPGVGSLLRRLETQDLRNVRVMLGDASEILAQRIPDASLTAVHLFFPDPWPKKRHHKRRLVQPEFAALVARKLEAGGYFHLATDWPAYAEHMVSVMSRIEGLDDASGEEKVPAAGRGALIDPLRATRAPVGARGAGPGVSSAGLGAFAARSSVSDELLFFLAGQQPQGTLADQRLRAAFADLLVTQDHRPAAARVA